MHIVLAICLRDQTCACGVQRARALTGLRMRLRPRVSTIPRLWEMPRSAFLAVDKLGPSPPSVARALQATMDFQRRAPLRPPRLNGIELSGREMLPHDERERTAVCTGWYAPAHGGARATRSLYTHQCPIPVRDKNAHRMHRMSAHTGTPFPHAQFWWMYTISIQTPFPIPVRDK